MPAFGISPAAIAASTYDSFKGGQDRYIKLQSENRRMFAENEKLRGDIARTDIGINRESRESEMFPIRHAQGEATLDATRSGINIAEAREGREANAEQGRLDQRDAVTGAVRQGIAIKNAKLPGQLAGTDLRNDSQALKNEENEETSDSRVNATKAQHAAAQAKAQSDEQNASVIGYAELTAAQKRIAANTYAIARLPDEDYLQRQQTEVAAENARVAQMEQEFNAVTGANAQAMRAKQLGIEAKLRKLDLEVSRRILHTGQINSTRGAARANASFAFQFNDAVDMQFNGDEVRFVGADGQPILDNETGQAAVYSVSAFNRQFDDEGKVRKPPTAKQMDDRSRVVRGRIKKMLQANKGSSDKSKKSLTASQLKESDLIAEAIMSDPEAMTLAADQLIARHGKLAPLRAEIAQAMAQVMGIEDLQFGDAEIDAIIDKAKSQGRTMTRIEVIDEFAQRYLKE